MPDFFYSVSSDNSVIGNMPEGEVKFDSAEAYEDAYIDALFEYSNEFELDNGEF